MKNCIPGKLWIIVWLLVGLALMGAQEALAQESALPRTLVIGGSLEALLPLMIEDCERTQELHYTGEQAAPFTDQVQVNCWGLDILGGSRKVEFMFNDGPLGHVWILVEREELDDLRQSLARSFGEVVYETDLDAVLASGTVAVRTRPAEILVATPELISALTGFRATEP
ncbi:MAG: hypothetical protein ABFS14_02235 [Gemmatimonadota bacterium]